MNGYGAPGEIQVECFVIINGVTFGNGGRFIVDPGLALDPDAIKQGLSALAGRLDRAAGRLAADIVEQYRKDMSIAFSRMGALLENAHERGP